MIRDCHSHSYYFFLFQRIERPGTFIHIIFDLSYFKFGIFRVRRAKMNVNLIIKFRAQNGIRGKRHPSE